MHTPSCAYAHMLGLLEPGCFRVWYVTFDINLCTQAGFFSCLMQREAQSEAACPKGLTSLRRLWCIFRWVRVRESDLCARSMHMLCKWLEKEGQLVPWSVL